MALRAHIIKNLTPITLMHQFSAPKGMREASEFRRLNVDVHAYYACI